MADNLLLKGSTWHVRLEIPADVRHAFGNRRKLTKSLKTGNKAEAHIRKLPVLAEWKTVISKSRNGIDAEELENELHLQKRVSETLNGFFESTLLKHVRGEKLFTKENALSFIKIFDSDISIIFKNKPEEAKAWRLRFYEAGSRFYDQEGKQNTDLVADFLKTTEEFLVIKNKFFSKKSGYSEKQAKQITDVFIEPNSYSPKSPFTSARLDAFAKHQIEVKGLSKKTVDSYVSKLKVLKNYLEKNNLDLSFENYQQFLDSLDEVQTKTKQNHIHSGSGFHKWASKYDQDYKNRFDSRDNPFLGHELPNNNKKGKKKEEKRLAFKAEEVKKLYDIAISKQKHQVAYAIKIAGLTGCRIEEICKLKKNHIVAESGILSFYIEEGKTDASIRKIPIHHNLKPLIEQLVKNADKDGYLIYSSGGNKYGIRSDSISKAFGRIKRELGYDSRYVFHSIRKTVITALQHNDVKPLVIASIVGHETGTVTFDIYSEGASAKQKLEAIKTLKNI
ncbi:tyrosine-type recombinase/integrase [Halomonas sp. ZH2S]|uniref:Tyrosine-type recombinase/integrase n=1 Tax=Vreelandella zhuhanensis TaxID=2684210 RepID=A0A7X3H4H9_9GAMM|nr:tyrosine-type recombinase/integrase [Halomonas zhuhanensis]MWJ29498.1 tyrosine-type recombinase/integrase [Halomonas zhuhanensis]